MTSQQRTVLGISLLAAGAILILVAALVTWNAVQNWIAVSETVDASKQVQRGRFDDARRLAASAARRAPGELAPALLALDTTNTDGLDRIIYLALRADRRADRQAALATVALTRMVLGKASDVDLSGTADLRLIGAMAAARDGKDPGKSLKAVADEEPPHLNVVRALHTMLMRRAWEAGKLDDLRTCLLYTSPSPRDH
jgi:hypothetical protein